MTDHEFRFGKATTTRPRASARLIRLDDMDDEFDRRFWDSIPHDERFAEAWRLTLEVWTLGGRDTGEPGLPRRTARVIRR